MAICRGCGDEIQWGFCDGRWVPLEPVKSHDDLDRTYVDENGELRADHRDRHDGQASVNVVRLDSKVKVADVETEQSIARRFAAAARAARGKG